MRPANRGRLALPGKRPAFVQCRLSALQLGGELEPLLGEIQQDSRVLGGVGRLGQFLASRGVRTTFSRIGGHSANPCATLHARKRRMVPVNKGRLRPNSSPKGDGWERPLFRCEQDARKYDTTAAGIAAERAGFRWPTLEQTA
jgi:hypothetical protein